MPFQTTRTATTDDYTRLSQAARRFADRWGLPRWDGDEAANVQSVVDDAYRRGGDSRKLRAYWKACARRALRHDTADEIAYGYVGHGINAAHEHGDKLDAGERDPRRYASGPSRDEADADSEMLGGRPRADY